MDIKGCSAIVTGGASGLGLATVRRLLDLGAKVVISDLKAPDSDLGADVKYVETDVTDEASMQAAVDAAVEMGPLAVLVSCAGIGIPKKVLGREGPESLSIFSKVIQVNLIGSYNALRLAAWAMSKRDVEKGAERGVIVNTSSLAAYEGQIGQTAYSASKAGLVGLTLPAARELARSGIRVMSIAPGIFDTPMLAALPEPVRKSLGDSVPFPSRLGQPEEFAQLVGQIVENPMLNGTTIRIDGALRMGPK